MKFIRAYDIVTINQLSGSTDTTVISPGEDDNYWRIQDFAAVGYELSVTETRVNLTTEMLVLKFFFTINQN